MEPSALRRAVGSGIIAGLLGEPGRATRPIAVVAGRNVTQEPAARGTGEERQVSRDAVAGERREYRRGSRVPRQRRHADHVRSLHARAELLVDALPEEAVSHAAAGKEDAAATSLLHLRQPARIADGTRDEVRRRAEQIRQASIQLPGRIERGQEEAPPKGFRVNAFRRGSRQVRVFQGGARKSCSRQRPCTALFPPGSTDSFPREPWNRIASSS